jgi:hypothetical protein
MVATDDPTKDVLATARAYTGRGWRVVPILARTKKPVLPAWQHLRLEVDELDQAFRAAGGVHANIGIILGEPSGGLVDVDCDCLGAVLAGQAFLPTTGLRSGHQSNPMSHFWYVVQEGALPANAKYPYPNADGQREMIVELRSTGCQTVVPPSIHPSGEPIVWRGISGEPGTTTADVLARAVAKTAACALLARHWPGQGSRDEAALALAGMLIRAGWSAQETDTFIETVAKIADDEEWRQRGKGQHTQERLAAGGSVTGAQTLAGLLHGDGKKVVSTVRQWLRLPSSSEREHDLAGAAFSRTAILSPIVLDSRRTNSMVQDQQYGEKSSDGGLVGPAPLIRTVGCGRLAADVTPEVIQWLWRGRIPLGALALTEGDPGVGKSSLTADLAARTTQGWEMPDGTPGLAEGPAGVLVLSGEDAVAATIIPRLQAAGADLARIYILEHASLTDAETGAVLGQRRITLPGDVDLLEEQMDLVSARLVLIDPIMLYLDPRLNSWRDQDMRAALEPLAKLAERRMAAIILVRHLTKGGGTNPLYRGGGSIGIAGAARSVLLVGKPSEDEHILAHSKTNLGRIMPSLRFRLRADAEEQPAHVEWLGTSPYSARALLNQNPVDETTELGRAMGFLHEALADGERAAREVEAEANEAGIATWPLREAARRLHVVRNRTGFGSGGFVSWRLPSPEGASGEDAPPVDENGDRGEGGGAA